MVRAGMDAKDLMKVLNHLGVNTHEVERMKQIAVSKSCYEDKRHMISYSKNTNKFTLVV